MTSEIAAMLDELMGRNRNLESGKTSDKGKVFFVNLIFVLRWFSENYFLAFCLICMKTNVNLKIVLKRHKWLMKKKFLFAQKSDLLVEKCKIIYFSIKISVSFSYYFGFN